MSGTGSDIEKGLATGFFPFGGEMAARIEAFDWSRTPIGPLERWPESLKTAVRLVMGSRYPMFVWWGPSMINLYNDAYIPVLGNRHPDALGRPASEIWTEIWETIGPQTRIVLNEGRATWNENLLLVMERNGYSEETYFTFSYSPIADENGIGGLFCACMEETGRVVGERRLRTLRDVAARTAEAKTAEEVCRRSAAVLAENAYDLPFVLLYLIEGRGERARLVAAAGLEPGGEAAPSTVEIAPVPSESNGWPLALVAASGRSVVMASLPTRFGRFPGGPWPQSPDSAVVLPIIQHGQPAPAGFLIAGLSPKRPFDDDYRSFVELVAGQVSTAVSSALAYEDERRRSEMLAELDRAKTAFFTNVSHEFRTPLTLILGPLEAALSRGADALSSEQREQLTVAHRNGLRLLKLVNSLLDFSRIEADRVQAVYEPTDLAQFTADLAGVFRSPIEQAGLRLTVDCRLLPEPVYVDRDLWEKIVLNLLSNAFKFTFTGDIVCALHGSGEHVELTVRDTGIGIPEAELPHMFERFHRVQGARGRTYEGTGIGLALVKELVRLHGGGISVSSVEGQGSIFTVTIPTGTAHLPADRIRHAEPRSTPAVMAAAYVEEALRWLPDSRDEDGQAAAGGTGPRPRVLLVDDNADMREYVGRLLRRHYEVELAADGEAALAAAVNRPPDLILTDVMMPRMGGVALLRALRADRRLQAIPVILLSARAGEESRVEGLETGADDYVIKPFSARELLARVRTHLELARVRREAARREHELRAEAEELYHTAQESERLSHERFKELDMLYQTAPVGLCLVDREFRYLRANHALADMNGVAVGDMLGRTLREIVPHLADIIEPMYRRVFETGKPIINAELRGRTAASPDLERAWLVSYFPITDDQGAVSAVNAVIKEITDIKRTEEEIRSLNRALAEKVAAYEKAVTDLKRAKTELEERNEDLEKFHDVVVGRELKLMELERELQKLKSPKKV